MTNVQLEAQQFCDIVIYSPERATAVTRRPYPGVYNAGPVVNTGASVRDLHDGKETCISDCEMFLTLRRTPDDISEFLDIFNVPFCYADSVQLADVKDNQAYDHIRNHGSLPTHADSLGCGLRCDFASTSAVVDQARFYVTTLN